MKILIATVGLCVSMAGVRSAQAATVTAASCNRADVGAAVNAAGVGDTVQIPAGTCSWTTELDISKGIALMGKGTGSTVILDDVPKDGSEASSILSFTITAPDNFRLSSLTIQGSALDTDVFNRCHVRVNGTTQAFRIDNVNFTSQRTCGIRIEDAATGLIDHSNFSGNFKQGVVVIHDKWGGAGYGDGSWTEPLYLGTEKAIYIEDCSFTELNTSQSSGAIDSFDGARIVFRHNTLTNQNGTSHGADSHQRGRGTRWLEIYNNTYTFDSGHVVAYVQWIRGGTGVFYNNTITTVVGNGPNAVVQASNCRDASAGCGGGPSYAPWGACDGSSPYDQNAIGGYRCVDQPGAGTSNPISGDTPTPIAWVGNISDPIYVWNNTVNQAPSNIVSGSTNVQPNRDFFMATPRPGYTAYTYPHPLVKTPPAAPTNVRVVGQ